MSGPYAIDYVRYGWHLLSGFRAHHELDMAEQRDRDLAPMLDQGRPLRILDLANGRLRPQYMILKARGHEVYGIDMINRPQRSRLNTGYQVVRGMYAGRLRLPHEATVGRTLACGDVGSLPFPDESFDLVTSIAAFEHFLDVPGVVAEIRRVLRPNGLAWVCVHLFTSPSGGHNVTFTEIPMRHVPSGVEVWDHLRRRRLAWKVPLNEWRKHQYLEAFGSRLTILKEYCYLREGEELLTPQIEADLAGYSRDELTCQSYVIVARKASVG